LISIGDIRNLFKLGRTAAYELTHRPEFPEPVAVSSRCYRWWASEVDAYADTLRLKHSRQSVDATQQVRKPNASNQAAQPRRITGKVRAPRGRKESS
jgi:predicted DNA-binding transcriptional regulator AlpA